MRAKWISLRKGGRIKPFPLLLPRAEDALAKRLESPGAFP